MDWWQSVRTSGRLCGDLKASFVLHSAVHCGMAPPQTHTQAGNRPEELPEAALACVRHS
jgi:hypothetical protein